MQRHRLTRYLAVVGSLALAPAIAQAQAFGLNEIGSCAFSRGFSATSAPCNDASTIFWNPAFAAGLKGKSVYAGVAAINISAKFTRDSALGEHEADVPTQIVPHVFANYVMGNMAFGVGAYVPYGLTSQWKDNFPGIYSAKKAAISTIYIQPNFAYSFMGGKYMIGGGPIWGMSHVELIQEADLADQIASVTTTTNPSTVTRFSQLGVARRTNFAQATLKGDATGIGYNVGFMAKMNDRWTFGIRYLSNIDFEYNDADATFRQDSTGIVFSSGNPLGYPAGTRFDTLASVRARFCKGTETLPAQYGGPAYTCTAPGLLGAQTVKTHINHPNQLQLGLAYRGFKDWMIAVDYDFTGWRRFKELPVNFQRDSLNTFCTTGAPVLSGAGACDYEVLDRTLIEDYNNTSAIRIGAERTLKNGWLLRAGFSGVASAAPDETVTPLLPEQDRTYWSLGTEVPLMKDRATLDLAYGFVWGSGRRGRIDERASRSIPAATLNSGVYSLHAHELSASINANL